MEYINQIIEKAKKNKKTIVLPETMDERVVEAASIVLKDNIANIILIGNEDDIKNKYGGFDLSMAKFIDPFDSSLTNKLVDDLYELRKSKGVNRNDAHDLLTKDFMYYACMLVYEGLADGVVSGACHSSANTLRPALQILKSKDSVKNVSAFFLMDVPNTDLGYNGVFLFGDAGLVQDPNSEELAEIAGLTSESFELLTGEKAICAMLSHSTKGSAKHKLVDKVVLATDIAKEKYPQYLIDGELQLDAAIVPEVANLKNVSSPVAGKANVLIFPNLDAGNIGYKLVQRLGNAKAYGPITQGMKKPVNDLSRGCSISDIVGVIAITCIQANKK